MARTRSSEPRGCGSTAGSSRRRSWRERGAGDRPGRPRRQRDGRPDHRGGRLAPDAPEEGGGTPLRGGGRPAQALDRARGALCRALGLPPARGTSAPLARGEDRAWPRNGIDSWILARLEREGLRPSPEADRFTLLRRVSLDLTGLPPTPEEVEAFADDPSPDAYEKAVDRLLADPAYGERWARMWLDLARYADSAGYGSDPLRPNIWRYRDWVIDAFNRNLPFDQFTVEQLAGDLLPEPDAASSSIATAFHRNTMTNTEGGTDDEEFRVAAVKDRVDTTLQVWMGLTMGCAKCHTHKYDPITQEEYFRFFAFFNQTADADRPDETPVIPAPTPAQQEQNRRIDAQIAGLKAAARRHHARDRLPPRRAGRPSWASVRNGSCSSRSRPAPESGATFESLPDGSHPGRRPATPTARPTRSPRGRASRGSRPSAWRPCPTRRSPAGDGPGGGRQLRPVADPRRGGARPGRGQPPRPPGTSGSSCPARGRSSRWPRSRSSRGRERRPGRRGRAVEHRLRRRGLAGDRRQHRRPLLRRELDHAHQARGQPLVAGEAGLGPAGRQDRPLEPHRSRSRHPARRRPRATARRRPQGRLAGRGGRAPSPKLELATERSEAGGDRHGLGRLLAGRVRRGRSPGPQGRSRQGLGRRPQAEGAARGGLRAQGAAGPRADGRADDPAGARLTRTRAMPSAASGSRSRATPRRCVGPRCRHRCWRSSTRRPDGRSAEGREALARHYRSIAPALQPVRDEIARLEKARPEDPDPPGDGRAAAGQAAHDPSHGEGEPHHPRQAGRARRPGRAPPAPRGRPERPARPGAVAGRPEEPAHGPGRRQPALVAALRHRAGGDRGGFRHQGELPSHPEAARLAGPRIRPHGLGHEGPPADDRHLGDLSPVVAGDPRAAGEGPAQPAARRGRRGFGWRRRWSATRPWP